MDRVPLASLEADWRRDAESPVPSWWRSDPALSHFATPAAVLAYLRRPGDPTGKDAVLLALLVQAPRDPAAGRVVLQAMLPGLKSVAARLLVDAAEREELWSTILASAWERICRYPVDRRPRRVAANLRLDTLRDTVAERARRRADRHELADPQAVAPSSSKVDGDVERLLLAAAAAGAITGDEAELILATRIDGQRLADIARAEGVAYNTLKLRRQRAERRLLVHLGYRPVPRGPQRRPSSDARVAGARSGLAGGIDQSR